MSGASYGVPSGDRRKSAATFGIRTFAMQRPDLSNISAPRNNYVRVDSGLSFLTPAAISDADALVALDTSFSSYLNGVQFCHDADPSLPVITDFSSMTSQGSVVEVRVDDAFETFIYVYNHFSDLYGIYDPIQVWYEVVTSREVLTHGVFTLGPSETRRFRMSELAGRKLGTGLFRYRAYHPEFRRIPNRRFRCVADIVSATTCITHHGEELEPRRVKDGAWFDTHMAALGPDRDLSLLLRTDPGADGLEVEATVASDSGAPISRRLTVKGVHLADISLRELFGTGAPDSPARVTLVVRGVTGRPRWATSWLDHERRQHLLSNHGNTRPMSHMGLGNDSRQPVSLAPEREELLRRWAGAGLILFPFPVMITPPESPFEFAVSTAMCVPVFDRLDVAVFGAMGQLVARGQEQLVPDAFSYCDVGAFAVSQSVRAGGGVAFLSPPYLDERLYPSIITGSRNV